MARNKRRVTRSNPQPKPSEPEPAQPSPASTRSSLTPVQDDEPPAPEPVGDLARIEEDKCPECKDQQDSNVAPSAKENWIRCDACKTWYHWVCAGDGGDLDAIDKWQVCRVQHQCGTDIINGMVVGAGTASRVCSRSLLERSRSSPQRVSQRGNEHSSTMRTSTPAWNPTRPDGCASFNQSR